MEVKINAREMVATMLIEKHGGSIKNNAVVCAQCIAQLRLCVSLYHILILSCYHLVICT